MSGHCLLVLLRPVFEDLLRRWNFEVESLIVGFGFVTVFRFVLLVREYCVCTFEGNGESLSVR